MSLSQYCVYSVAKLCRAVQNLSWESSQYLHGQRSDSFSRLQYSISVRGRLFPVEISLALVCVCCLTFLLCSFKKTLAQSLPSCSGKTAIRFHLTFFMWNKYTSLSLSFWGKCSSSMTTAVVLLWFLCSSSVRERRM